MARRQEYRVILRDANGYTIGSERPVFGPLKEAKETARYLASEAYAMIAETTHKNLGSDHVDILDEAGDIVWDLTVKT